MVKHDAATVVLGKHKRKQQRMTGLDRELAHGIAMVSFSVMRRNRPGLTGGRLWAVLADQIREEFSTREMETNVLAAAYALVFPSLSLGGEHV